jgi:hypothetical protein
VEDGTANTVRWITDRTGTPRVRWEYSAFRHLFSIYARKDGSDKWEKVVEYGERDIPEINVLGFTDDPNVAVVLANQKTDKTGVYEFNLASKTMGRSVFQHPKVDVGTPLGGPIYDYVTWRLVGVRYADDRIKAEFFDPQLKQIQAEIDGAFPNSPERRPLTWSRDRMTVVVYTIGPTDPGSYYIFDRRAKKMQPFGSARDHIQPAWLGEMRTANFAARDGVTISAYLTLPPGGQAKNLPLVVHPHGGPEVRDVQSYDYWVQAMASRGYAVFQPNFRGSGGYGRAFAAAGHRQWANACRMM